MFTAAHILERPSLAFFRGRGIQLALQSNFDQKPREISSVITSGNIMQIGAAMKSAHTSASMACRAAKSSGSTARSDLAARSWTACHDGCTGGCHTLDRSRCVVPSITGGSRENAFAMCKLQPSRGRHMYSHNRNSSRVHCVNGPEKDVPVVARTRTLAGTWFCSSRCIVLRRLTRSKSWPSGRLRTSDVNHSGSGKWRALDSPPGPGTFLLSVGYGISNKSTDMLHIVTWQAARHQPGVLARRPILSQATTT